MKQLRACTKLQALLLLFIATSCIDETMTADINQITFRIFSSEEDLLTDLPRGSKLTINFESSDGKELIRYDDVQFTQLEKAFVTTLKMPGPNYRITDFVIVNPTDEVVYALPKSDAPLSVKLKTLLPEFRGRADVKLLDVQNYKPADFGYTSFTNPNQGLKVIVTLAGSSKPVSAEAYLMNEADTLQRYKLKAGLNIIPVADAMQGNARLIIQKRSYADYTINVSSIAEEGNRKPLKIILEPAFKMLSWVERDSEYKFLFEFFLAGDQVTTISVNWGDGVKESFTFTDWQNLVHEYAEGGIHPITITGDLDHITVFHSEVDNTKMNDVDFTHLTSLKILTYSYLLSPSTLDLTMNTKLDVVDLSGLYNLEMVYLPEDHGITMISMMGPNKMTTASVDAVIDNLYRNTVANNTMNGIIQWAVIWAPEEGITDIVGPPSSVALAQVKIMKEKYGWTLEPDPFGNDITAATIGRVTSYKKGEW
jgi:hypothetical protein